MKALSLLALAAAAGCALAPAGRSTSAHGGLWHYDVTLSEDLARIDVRMTFAMKPPPRLMLGMDEGAPYLDGVAIVRGATSTPLTKEAGTFLTGDAAASDEIVWHVDLARLATDRLGSRVGRDLCASPGLWLLRPYHSTGERHATLSLHLPEGASASVPWPPTDDGAAYLLDESSFRWRGFVAFGPMERHVVAAAGTKLEVAILDFPHAAAWPALERWITSAADAVGDLYGGFPVPRAQIVLKPVPANSAVIFGETQRGGGPAAMLLIGRDAADAEYADDWVATHEFSHLGMPAMDSADAWMSEGFVQYYTQVLRGRAGIVDERTAWQEAVEGFGRGRHAGASQTLADDSVSMDRRHAYMRVYWGGAAIALLCDVELRRSSNGARTLDDAIREVSRAFAAEVREVSAAEIVAHLDTWAGRPLFSEITSRHLAAKEFPDVTGVLAELGVVTRGRRVELDDAAPLAAMRRAMYAR